MEDEQPGSLRVAVEKIALGLVALLVLYVLSIGPAARLTFHHQHPGHWNYFGSFYAPILWACDHAKPLGRLGEAYCRLWCYGMQTE